MMTLELIRTLNRALALVAIGCGGFGMVLCVPYLLCTDIMLIIGSAIVFLAGAVLYGAGATSMAILIQKNT